MTKICWHIDVGSKAQNALYSTTSGLAQADEHEVDDEEEK